MFKRLVQWMKDKIAKFHIKNAKITWNNIVGKPSMTKINSEEILSVFNNDEIKK